MEPRAGDSLKGDIEESSDQLFPPLTLGAGFIDHQSISCQFHCLEQPDAENVWQVPPRRHQPLANSKQISFLCGKLGCDVPRADPKRDRHPVDKSGSRADKCSKQYIHDSMAEEEPGIERWKNDAEEVSTCPVVGEVDHRSNQIGPWQS